MFEGWRRPVGSECDAMREAGATVILSGICPQAGGTMADSPTWYGRTVVTAVAV